MKETLYTIPLTDAFMADTECPFCYIERAVEQDLMDYVLGSGSSYMESDTREQTDKDGFCREHFKKMFDYGNTLGNAWILKTHYQKLHQELQQQIKQYKPNKVTLMQKVKKQGGDNSMSAWVAQVDSSCYICNRFETTYERYLDTFFFMYKKDQDLENMLKKSKGFCLHHFGDLCERGELSLNDTQKATFYPLIFSIMEENFKRLSDDVSWMVEKFDYRNKDADWRQSKDAIQRGMQKIKGGFPADPPYKTSK